MKLQTKNSILNQRAWLFILAWLCFLGALWGLAIISPLPRYTITLAFGSLGMLVIATYPMLGLFLFLFSLYFPIFPSVTVGSIEFSSSTLLVVGLIIGIFRASALSIEKVYLLGWQKAMLIAIGIVFFVTSLFTSSFNATISFVPNLVIYLLILFAIMAFVSNPEKLYTIVKLSLVFAFIISFWQDVLEPIRLLFGISSLGGVNGMVFAFHPAIAFALIAIFTPARQVFSTKWKLFGGLVLLSLIVHGIYFETRAAWLAWGIISILLLIRLPLRSWVQYVPILLALIALVGVLLNGVISRNLDQTEGALAAVLGKQQSQISSDDLIRLVAQNAGLHMFYARPVLGWGPNTFQFLKPEFVDTGGKEGKNSGAFNSWLALLAEMGIAGVVVSVFACFMPLIKLFIGIGKLKDKDVDVYWLAYGCALGAVALAIHAFFITRMFSFFWFYVGLALSVTGLVDRYTCSQEIHSN